MKSKMKSRIKSKIFGSILFFLTASTNILASDEPDVVVTNEDSANKEINISCKLKTMGFDSVSLPVVTDAMIDAIDKIGSEFGIVKMSTFFINENGALILSDKPLDEESLAQKFNLTPEQESTLLMKVYQIDGMQSLIETWIKSLDLEIVSGSLSFIDNNLNENPPISENENSCLAPSIENGTAISESFVGETGIELTINVSKCGRKLNVFVGLYDKGSENFDILKELDLNKDDLSTIKDESFTKINMGLFNKAFPDLKEHKIMYFSCEAIFVEE